MSRSVMNSFIPGSIVLFQVNCSTLLFCALGICLRAGGLVGCPYDINIQNEIKILIKSTKVKASSSEIKITNVLAIAFPVSDRSRLFS